MVQTISRFEKDPAKAYDTINQLAAGRSNATGSFTLTASSTTTTVKAPTCSKTSFVFISPQTNDAANDMATTVTSAGKAQFVVYHANNTRVDRTFGYVILGGS